MLVVVGCVVGGCVSLLLRAPAFMYEFLFRPQAHSSQLLSRFWPRNPITIILRAQSRERAGTIPDFVQHCTGKMLYSTPVVERRPEPREIVLGLLFGGSTEWLLNLVWLGMACFC